MKKKAQIIGLISVLVIVVIAITATFIVRQMKEEDNSIVSSKDDDRDTEDKDKDEDEEAVDKNQDILIEADEVTDIGVSLTSSFTLLHKASVDVEEIKKDLKVTPEASFQVTEIGDKTYKIAFDEELPNKTNLKFKYTYEDELYGYGFRTLEPFVVRDVYPANASEYIDIDTVMEIEFSRKIDSSQFDLIQIEPKVDVTYTTSNDNMKLVILPEYPLSTGTEYTITIPNNIQSGDESLVEEYVYRFKTSEYSNYGGIRFGNGNVTVLSSSETQVISISGLEDKNADMLLDFYKINEESADAFIEYRSYAKREELLETGSRFYKSSSVEIVNQDNYSIDVSLDEYIEPGFYYARFGEPINAGGLFQVTDYSGYLTVDKDHVLAWIQHPSLETENIEIYAGDEKLGSTNDDGLCYAEYSPVVQEYNYFKAVTGQEVLYMPTYLNQPYESAFYDYYAYIYTDRNIYMPTDTIHVLGYVKERTVAPVDEVEIVLGYSGLEIDSKLISLNEDNSFETEFSIEDYNNGYLSLLIRVNGETIDSEYVVISNFEKPIYQLNMSIEEDYVMSQDEVHLVFGVSHYDGTPVKDATLKIDFNDYYNSWRDLNGNILGEEVYIAENGTVIETVQVQETSEEGWRPRYKSLGLQSLDLQLYYNYIYDSLLVFPKDRMLEFDAVKDDNSIEINGTCHEIDISKINGDPHDANQFRGEFVPNKEIVIDIQEIYYKKTFVERRYSSLYKMNYDVYTYERIENNVLETVVTTNEFGEFEYEYGDIVDDRYYYVVCSTNDKQGRYLMEKEYGYYYKDYDFMDYSLSQTQYTMETGESTEISVQFAGEPIESTEIDKLLIVEEKEGIKDFSITEDTSFVYTFDEGSMPDTHLKFIYFNGKIMTTNYRMGQRLGIDTNSRSMVFDIEFDKEKYEPGDTVNYSLRMYDLEGNPKEGSVNLSVVDESIFAIYEDESYPLEEIFEWNYHDQIYGSYLMSETHDFASGAEQGGEGGPDYMRDDFQNTAYFHIVRTNSDGFYEGSFELPDNITEWRVTFTGLTSDLYVGKTRVGIKAGLPFFVIVNNEESYLENDHIVIGTKTAGGVEFVGTNPNFKVFVEDSQGNKVYENEFVSLFTDYEFIDVGVLPMDTYNLHVEVISEDKEINDYVKLPFEVKDNIAFYDIEEVEDLTLESTLTSNNNYVSMMMFNYEAYDFYKEIERIAYQDDEIYSPIKISSFIAKQFIDEVFYHNEGDRYSIRSFGSEGGLIKETQASGGSLYATARMLSAGLMNCTDDIDETLILEYVKEVVEYDKALDKRYFSALWIGNLLGENYYDEVKEIETEYDNIDTLESKLYAIRLIAEIGDLTVATKCYDKLIEEYEINIVEDIEQLSDSKEENELLLAFLLGITTDIQKFEEASYLYDYFVFKEFYEIDYRFDYYISHLEAINYLTKMERPELNAKVTYEILGEESTIELGFYDTLYETLKPEEADSFRVLEVNGEVLLLKDYVGHKDNFANSIDSSVERSVVNLEGEQSIQIGDIVEVTLTFERNDNDYYFNIQEPLPAGLTYYGSTESEYYMYGYTSNLGDRVEINGGIKYQYRESSPTTISFSYKAIATSPGEYSWEPVMINNYNGYNKYISETDKIKIEIQ